MDTSVRGGKEEAWFTESKPWRQKDRHTGRQHRCACTPLTFVCTDTQRTKRTHSHTQLNTRSRAHTSQKCTDTRQQILTGAQLYTHKLAELGTPTAMERPPGLWTGRISQPPTFVWRFLPPSHSDTRKLHSLAQSYIQTYRTRHIET